MTTELLPQAGSRVPRVAVREDPGTQDLDAPTRELLYRYSARLGLPLVCVDHATGRVLEATTEGATTLLPRRLLEQAGASRGPVVLEHGAGLAWGVVPLSARRGRGPLAVATVRSRAAVDPHEVALLAADRDWSQAQLDRWLAAQPLCAPSVLKSLVALAARQEEQDETEETLRIDLDALGTQIDRTYEEITLLHGVTRNLQLSRTPADLAGLCLDQLHELVPSEGLLIWIEETRGSGSLLVEGALPFDEVGLARLLARFDAWDWSRPLVKNRVQGTALGAEFPGLRDFVATPIAEGAHRAGWILGVNMPAGREFGTVEASLLNSIATILGTHIRNIDLYEQHAELLLSFVRSLVWTLDAKDPYTRGHSERVALVARRVAAEMGLSGEERQDIYLAGLLHDIGKIGVDERILQKPGQLTDEEFKEIQKHPMIGYNILQGLRNLQKVLPGVRNHHESWNGKGYPDGLRGEEIPLMARILAVADSYDAMSSDRPYRKGMSLEKLEDIFRRGAGEQWDPRIIAAYFAARDDIRETCASYSPSNGNLLPVS